MKRIFLLMFCWLATCAMRAESGPSQIDLSGIWRFQLDPLGFGKTPGSELYLDKLAETIVLPGSTDRAGKGVKNNARHVDRLSRRFEYQGAAWYQREVVVPPDWKDKEIMLYLERCHWETTVYVDGRPAGSDERLSTPDTFVLTGFLTPGTHTLTLCVDNRLKYPMDQWNHATTEYTQTNWNGIVGTIALQAREKLHIRRIRVDPDVAKKQIRARVTFSDWKSAAKGTLEFRVRRKNGKQVASGRVEIDSITARKGLVQTIGLGDRIDLWDEFTPFLYELEATLLADGKKDVRSVTFGMRVVEQGAHHIRLNGRDIHLRGVLDCAVFPLTGYPSTDPADWKRIFSTIREYGMNHVRFHSWCPPEAAFDAADELGLYLQAELPMWIKDAGRYPDRRRFFEEEMYAILDAYGNHPSFLLMCNGNENEGDFAVLEDLVKKARAYDDRRLYSASTARTHTASDQYYVSHVTANGWITVYEGKPATDWDRDRESAIDVPVIAHETGQRCMYPDFEEIRKYTGVLEARNFEVFRERLARNGMLHQARDFFRVTGAHTVLQYKEVNESLLRTRRSGGFQLLGLADFPGQGSAFVGILDAFWESKGLVTPEKFRESCAPTVLLARLPKRAYLTGERFTAGLEIYHYGKEAIKGRKLNWKLTDETGKVVRSGMLSVGTIRPSTVDSLGTIGFGLDGFDRSCKLTLQAEMAGVRNEWDIWVYPPATGTENDPVCVRSWDEETKKLLSDGKSVLLIPAGCEGRRTRFAGHFWNPVMFNWDPMIVGTLIAAGHPAFRDFPTDAYADWQWWDILNHATALEMDGLPEITPVIQSVDSYETNRKLGIAFEAGVGKGKLFVLCVDPEKEIDRRPATRQLLVSVKNYVASERFAPARNLSFYELDALFQPAAAKKMRVSFGAALRQLLNK